MDSSEEEREEGFDANDYEDSYSDSETNLNIGGVDAMKEEEDEDAMELDESSVATPVQKKRDDTPAFVITMCNLFGYKTNDEKLLLSSRYDEYIQMFDFIKGELEVMFAEGEPNAFLCDFRVEPTSVSKDVRYSVSLEYRNPVLRFVFSFDRKRYVDEIGLKDTWYINFTKVVIGTCIFVMPPLDYDSAEIKGYLYGIRELRDCKSQMEKDAFHAKILTKRFCNDRIYFFLEFHFVTKKDEKNFVPLSAVIGKETANLEKDLRSIDLSTLKPDRDPAISASDIKIENLKKFVSNGIQMAASSSSGTKRKRESTVDSKKRSKRDVVDSPSSKDGGSSHKDHFMHKIHSKFLSNALYSDYDDPMDVEKRTSEADCTNESKQLERAVEAEVLTESLLKFGPVAKKIILSRGRGRLDTLFDSSRLDQVACVLVAALQKTFSDRLFGKGTDTLKGIYDAFLSFYVYAHSISDSLGNQNRNPKDYMLKTKRCASFLKKLGLFASCFLEKTRNSGDPDLTYLHLENHTWEWIPITIETKNIKEGDAILTDAESSDGNRASFSGFVLDLGEGKAPRIFSTRACMRYVDKALWALVCREVVVGMTCRFLYDAFFEFSEKNISAKEEENDDEKKSEDKGEERDESVGKMEETEKILLAWEKMALDFYSTTFARYEEGSSKRTGNSEEVDKRCEKMRKTVNAGYEVMTNALRDLAEFKAYFVKNETS